MIKYLLLLSFLMPVLTAFGQSSKISSTSSGNDNSDFPFFSFEYMETSSQVPISEKQDLSKLNTKFSSITSTINIPLYLDLENQKSALMLGLSHNYFRTVTKLPVTNPNFAAYATDIPNIHSFYLSLSYSQKLKQNLEFTGAGSFFLRSDFASNLSDQNFNYNLLFYLQRRFSNIGVGLGSVFYIVDGNFRTIPVIYFSYTKNKFKLALTPVSIDGKYLLGAKDFFQISGGIDFSGYSIQRSPLEIPPQIDPNFASILKFDVKTTYDRRITNGLHGALSLGYLYQEMEFYDGEEAVDKIKFENALYVSMKVYLTF